MKSRQTNPNSDLVDAAMAATGGVVIKSADAEAPLPPIPVDEKLTTAEQAVLGRLMEYSRKGSMRPRTVTRQQWVEDFLTRGFTQIERLQFGRSPVRLRITAPERTDRRGRPQFYEVQSAIEIAYVERRHAALFGKRATAAAEAPPVVAVATPVQAEPTDVSAAEAVAVAAPGLGAAWIEEIEGELAGQSGPGDEAGGEAGALVEAVGAGLSEREAALAESALGLLPSEASPAQVAQVRTRARRFATAFFRALDQRNIGRLLAVLERGDGLAAAGWEAFQQHGLQLAKGKRVDLTPANIRAEVRRWCSDAEWAAFLSQRVSRRIDTRNEAREARVSTFDPNGADFHYEPGTVVTPRGEKTRIRANIEAIKLLKLLESENREATPDEKAVLAKFNGWGAHKGLFEDRSSEMEQYKEWHGDDWLTLIRARAKKVERDYGAAYAETSTEVRFMKWYDAYGKEAVEIRELLTREEWESAARSILNAHYTSEEVCHFLWQIAERAGFMGGKVIDPAVGASGRVIAAMPPELRAKSRCEAVDIDSISARMAKKLFPQTKVHECGFEEALIAPGSADLVITNVPFSEHGPGVQTGLGPVRFNLHNYFVAESMRKLKPGGLAILITSAYTMDASDDQRGEMAKMAELWGAVRLPSDAFRGNAGTEVVTDVMLLRKPDGTMQPNAESWAQVLPVTVPAEGVFMSDKPGAKPRDVALVNEYYQRHPEHVLGYHSLQGSMYGRAENGQYTVTSPKDAAPLAERLTQVLAKLPANIPNSSQRAAVIRDAAFAAVEEPEKLMATLEELPGALVVREGRLYEVQPSRELILPEWVQKGLAPSGTGGMAKAQQLAQDYVDLREKLASQISLDLNRVTTPDMSRSHREELKEAYDGFVKRHGSLCDNTKRLRSIAPRDPSLGSVLALEIAREDKADRKKRIITPMPILTERTLFPPEQTLRAETIEDAVLVSINQTGGIDVPLIADLLGKDDVAAISEQLARGGQAFRLPEDPEKMEAKTSYLSGDVVSKLERAKKAAESDPRFIVNVGALEAVAPAPVPWENIRVQLGATWVPESVISSFLAKVTGAYFDDRDRVFYSPRSQRWVAPTLDNKYSAQAQARYGTQRAKWTDVVLSALNQKTMSIWDQVDEGGKILNVKATAEANARIEALKADWDAWLRQSPDAQAELTRRYNEVFNRVVVSDHDGNHLTFPGLAKGPGALVPRAYQKNAVARFLAKPAGVVAHGTGYGKTLTGILIAHESRRIGAARKPMIVCDSANYAQFVEAYRKAYPQDRILVADDANFSPAERENFKAMVAYGDWDCVLMSRTQFERIPVSTETEQRWLCQELDDLRYTFELMRQSGAKVEARRVEKKIEAKTQKLKEVLNEKAEKADRGLTWEQLGVDLLEVDECHRHKKCGFPSAHEKIKGIDTGISARGRDLLMKARFIQDRRDGRGAIGLSGTPATNTMAEFWNMVRLFDPKTLEDFNVAFFDEFKSAFCVTQNQLEMNEANGAYRYVERLSKFVNGPALISFVRQGCDVQLDATKLGLKLPKHKSGEIEFCIVPITDAALDQMDALADIYRIYESKGDKREYSWVPIMLMQCGMAASIDPRLVDPKAPDEESSLLNVLARNVAEIHHETMADKKTQCVFLDRYRRMDTSKLETLRKGKFEEIKIEIDDTADPVDADPDDEGAQVAPEPEDRPEEFNLYRELKAKLIGQGVPTEEIAIISEAKTPKERAEMFERVNRGEIRVIMGSSDKLGIGANFQQKLYAAHHFDPPRNMTPDQMEQRDGRILRSGNTNEEIRNIYYGMQDTVTPAIYNRIQTKRKFIKQGLSASARDVEFEDTSEVRLEELKAALVTDKRQLQMAELIASIKDERMQIDVQESRIGTLRSRINYLEGALRSVTLDELPAAEREAAFIAKHIMPFDGKLRVDFSNIAEGTNWRNPKVKEWIEKQGTTVHEGPAEEVEKKLRGLVDALKETEMNESQMEIQLGRLIVNGAPVRITLNQVTFKSSGREALALLARVANPADSAKGSSYLSDATHFGSAEMLTRTVAYAVRSAAERPASLQTKADSIRHDLKAVMAEAEQMAMPTRERLQSLEVAKKALEEDMAKNPYVRGADRRKPSLVGGAAAGMSTATAAPTMQTQPVKARS